MAYENVAYDLERYGYNYDDTNSDNNLVKYDLKLLESKPKKVPFKVKAMCYIMAMALVVIIISTQVTITEISQQITAANNKLNEINSESIRLDMELDSTGSKRSVEDKAGLMFGLSEENRGQVEYININKENMAIVNKDNRNIFEKMYYGFINLVEYMQQMFNNN